MDKQGWTLDVGTWEGACSARSPQKVVSCSVVLGAAEPSPQPIPFCFAVTNLPRQILNSQYSCLRSLSS